MDNHDVDQDESWIMAKREKKENVIVFFYQFLFLECNASGM